MKRTYRIEIPGRPVAKERARMARGQKPYTPPRTRAYEEHVAQACVVTRRERGRTLTYDLDVRIELHTKSALRGDLDNYAKSILDGLEKGQLFRNDKQIKQLSIQVAITPEHDEKAVVWVTETT